MTSRELIEKLKGLDRSNQLDTEAHRWAILVTLFELSVDDGADPEYAARRVRREGLDDAADVKRAMAAALLRKIGELSLILARLNADE